MMKRRLRLLWKAGIACLLVLLGFSVWKAVPGPAASPVQVSAKPASKPDAGLPPSPSRIVVTVPAASELADVPPNPMAAAIGTSAFTPPQEIAALFELFQTYRRQFGAFPAGEGNAQFMNALRGGNPIKMPIFPLRHPRLDSKGNLLDPWGIPYIFHPVSRDRLEIRTSGPDREIFTEDDLLILRE